MFKIIALTLTLFALTGCKLAILVVEGGEVQSIGSGTCLPGNICINEVSNTNYAESFTAVPANGWKFVKWNSGFRFFCANSTMPTCALNVPSGFWSSAVWAGSVAAPTAFYLMPVFELKKPITDTIMAADGREWVQPDFFSGLSWATVLAACPHGVCAGDLNGYDVDGWTLADETDVFALFSAYATLPPLSSLPYESNPSTSHIALMTAAGFHAIFWLVPIDELYVKEIGAFGLTADGTGVFYAVVTDHYIGEVVTGHAAQLSNINPNFPVAPWGLTKPIWMYR